MQYDVGYFQTRPAGSNRLARRTTAVAVIVYTERAVQN
jgi:hypothetical protein